MEFIHACWWMGNFNEATSRSVWNGERALVIPATRDRFIYCYRANSRLINLHLTSEDLFADDWQVVRQCELCGKWLTKADMAYFDDIEHCPTHSDLEIYAIWRERKIGLKGE